jgi:hypothetical protein
VHRRERGERVGEEEDREVARHGDAQPPERRLLPVLGEGGDVLDLGGHLPRVLEDPLAELGEPEPAGRPDHEPFAERLLEERDPPRDRRLRKAEPFGGAAEASPVGHPGEYQEVVRVQLFH